MNPLSEAVLKAGLIDAEMLAEFRQFKSPVNLDTCPEASTDGLGATVALIEKALQSEELSQMRETDFDAVQQYLTTSQAGTLHVEIEFEGDVQSTDLPVVYGKTRLGEYLIGWKSESIQDLLCNGRTYLVDGGVHVYFGDMRELFFGNRKAFVVCTPSLKEVIDDNLC